MKNGYLKILGLATVASSAFLFMSNRVEFSVDKFHAEKLNSNGAQSAKTGAPGESSCTFCHSGNAQDGNNGINSLTLDGGSTDYDPGVTNSMTLSLTDAASRNGFQLVALDENDDMAGSFTITDATNTQQVSNTQLGRDYITHTSPGNSLSTWSFDWEAPSDAGDVTFYVATNKTNSDGGSNGDVIYLSSHSFGNPQASIEEEEPKEETNFEIGYTPSDHSLLIDFPVVVSNDVSINVIDLSGKSVYFNNAGNFESGNYTEKIKLPESIENGIYVVTLFVGNQPYSKKVMINK